jgi:hypothetical protein
MWIKKNLLKHKALIIMFLGLNSMECTAQVVKPFIGASTAAFSHGYISQSADFGMAYKQLFHFSATYNYNYYLKANSTSFTSGDRGFSSLGANFSYRPQLQELIKPRVEFSYLQGVSTSENGLIFTYNTPASQADSTFWISEFERVKSVIKIGLYTDIELNEIIIFFGGGYQWWRLQNRSIELPDQKVIVKNRGMYFSLGVIYLLGKNSKTTL